MHHASSDGGNGVRDFLGEHVAMLEADGGGAAFEMDVNPTTALEAVRAFQAGIAGSGAFASARDSGIEVVLGGFGVIGVLASQPQESSAGDEDEDGGEATNSIGHGSRLLGMSVAGISVLLTERRQACTEGAEDTEFAEKRREKRERRSQRKNKATEKNTPLLLDSESGFREGSLIVPGSLHYAARRARMRRGKKSRAASVGMTKALTCC
jgi:hypothetical protein